MRTKDELFRAAQREIAAQRQHAVMQAETARRAAYAANPALSAADVGIAISDGAELAREIADVTIAAEDLFEVVTLRKLSKRLMKRIYRNYKVIVGFNSALIAGGIAGVLQPTTSALLHNTSTLLIAMESMKPLLHEENQ
mgnify:CR=1 FL=1